MLLRAPSKPHTEPRGARLRRQGSLLKTFWSIYRLVRLGGFLANYLVAQVLPTCLPRQVGDWVTGGLFRADPTGTCLPLI